MQASRAFAIAFILAPGLIVHALSQAAEKPNIVLIYADDLGYGDVGCYGAKRIATPNIDRVAREGLRLTSGYSAAATCTPSRYALLTGEYAWRQEGTGILPGSASLIIKPGRTTLPSILQKAGYRTGVVGKWHLGLGDGPIDWNGEIKPGPLEIGFDESFLMPATGDRVPCVYLKGYRVVGLDPNDPITVSYGQPIPGIPTGRNNPELLTKMRPSHGHDMTIVNGISRIGYMKGGTAALWKDEDMADVFAREAVNFVSEKRDQPFFLFFALHDPHVPRVPHPRFVGKTDLGPRGDAIVQADWCVGEVLSALDRLGIARNTLVIVTCDNGPVVDDGYQDQAREKLGDHQPSGPLRGGKYSKFEAGCRVPFVLRWPERIKPGVSDAIISQVDFLASFAVLTDQEAPAAEAPDSQDVLPALLGESKTGRESVVLQGTGGLALRRGNWKYIPPNPRAGKANANTRTELGNDQQPQLYDLANDLGERTNLAEGRSEVVMQLAAELDAIRAKKSDPK
jgi:arylsulfatase A-like enzyme